MQHRRAVFVLLCLVLMSCGAPPPPVVVAVASTDPDDRAAAEGAEADAGDPGPIIASGVPAPTDASPSRGPANAKIVVQVFADFQCPWCKRANHTLLPLFEKEYPGNVRIVWRNRPLPMHKDASITAEAAMEAFKQKGSAGFWAMHDTLFAAQGTPDAFERPALERYAQEIGLDLLKFRAALDTSAHKAAIDADIKIAEAAGISDTPGIVVNGYFVSVVSGAQPLSEFKRVAKTVLAEP